MLQEDAGESSSSVQPIKVYEAEELAALLTLIPPNRTKPQKKFHTNNLAIMCLEKNNQQQNKKLLGEDNFLGRNKNVTFKTEKEFSELVTKQNLKELLCNVFKKTTYIPIGTHVYGALNLYFSSKYFQFQGGDYSITYDLKDKNIWQLICSYKHCTIFPINISLGSAPRIITTKAPALFTITSEFTKSDTTQSITQRITKLEIFNQELADFLEVYFAMLQPGVVAPNPDSQPKINLEETFLDIDKKNPVFKAHGFNINPQTEDFLNEEKKANNLSNALETKSFVSHIGQFHEILIVLNGNKINLHRLFMTNPEVKNLQKEGNTTQAKTKKVTLFQELLKQKPNISFFPTDISFLILKTQLSRCFYEPGYKITWEKKPITEFRYVADNSQDGKSYWEISHNFEELLITYSGQYNPTCIVAPFIETLRIYKNHWEIYSIKTPPKHPAISSFKKALKNPFRNRYKHYLDTEHDSSMMIYQINPDPKLRIVARYVDINKKITKHEDQSLFFTCFVRTPTQTQSLFLYLLTKIPIDFSLAILDQYLPITKLNQKLYLTFSTTTLSQDFQIESYIYRLGYIAYLRDFIIPNRTFIELTDSEIENLPGLLCIFYFCAFSWGDTFLTRWMPSLMHQRLLAAKKQSGEEILEFLENLNINIVELTSACKLLCASSTDIQRIFIKALTTLSITNLKSYLGCWEYLLLQEEQPYLKTFLRCYGSPYEDNKLFIAFCCDCFPNKKKDFIAFLRWYDERKDKPKSRLSLLGLYLYLKQTYEAPPNISMLFAQAFIKTDDQDKPTFYKICKANKHDQKKLSDFLSKSKENTLSSYSFYGYTLATILSPHQNPKDNPPEEDAKYLYNETPEIATEHEVKMFWKNIKSIINPGSAETLLSFLYDITKILINQQITKNLWNYNIYQLQPYLSATKQNFIQTITHRERQATLALIPEGRKYVIGNLEDNLKSFLLLIHKLQSLNVFNNMNQGKPEYLIFLGNFIHNSNSLEVFIGILRLKLLFPRNILILQGQKERSFKICRTPLEESLDDIYPENRTDEKPISTQVNLILDLLPTIGISADGIMFKSDFPSFSKNISSYGKIEDLFFDAQKREKVITKTKTPQPQIPIKLCYTDDDSGYYSDIDESSSSSTTLKQINIQEEKQKQMGIRKYLYPLGISLVVTTNETNCTPENAINAYSRSLVRITSTGTTPYFMRFDSNPKYSADHLPRLYKGSHYQELATTIIYNQKQKFLIIDREAVELLKKNPQLFEILRIIGAIIMFSDSDLQNGKNIQLCTEQRLKTVKCTFFTNSAGEEITLNHFIEEDLRENTFVFFVAGFSEELISYINQKLINSTFINPYLTPQQLYHALTKELIRR